MSPSQYMIYNTKMMGIAIHFSSIEILQGAAVFQTHPKTHTQTNTEEMEAKPAGEVRGIINGLVMVVGVPAP